MEGGSKRNFDDAYSTVATASHSRRDIQEETFSNSRSLTVNRKRKQSHHSLSVSCDSKKLEQHLQEEEAGSEAYGGNAEEEEDGDLSFCVGRNKWKRKKGNAKERLSDSTIIEEAEKRDGSEAAEEWEYGAEELAFVANNQGNEVGQTATTIDDRQRGTGFLDLENEAEIAEYFRRKYGRESSVCERFGDGANEETMEGITQQSLLPTVKDAKLWKVNCRKGEEKSTVLHLMRKCFTLDRTEHPLQIISAVATERADGFIYVEARSKSQIRNAIAGIGNLQGGIWKQDLIPLHEMVDILRVKKLQQNLQPKQWVRPTYGIYKGDIAQVDRVILGEKTAYLKLLPRVDYVGNRDGSRKKSRPEAKLFDPEKARAVGYNVVFRDDFWRFKGDQYSREGFLHKAYPIPSIISEGVVPTLRELEIFVKQAPGQMPDYGKLDSADMLKANSFSTCDTVEVCTGELKYLQLKVKSVDGALVTGMPVHEQLKEALTFRADELRKIFKIGDHVKVCAGRYSGETGTVVKMKAPCVVLLSDLTMSDLEILPQHLTLSNEIASDVVSSGRFMWGDLVMLDVQRAGVVIRLTKDFVHVLTMNDIMVERTPSSLQAVRTPRNIVGFDCNRTVIHCKDTIKVTEGPHRGHQGPIEHLYRDVVFLYSHTYKKNAGFFAVPTKNVCLCELNLVHQNYPRTPVPKTLSPARSNSDGYPQLLGKTIKIIAGAYKGEVGYVRYVTNDRLRVELHSSCQTISVHRSHVMVVGKNLPESTATAFGSHTVNYYGSQTPLYGSERSTPFGIMTPSPQIADESTTAESDIKKQYYKTFS